MHTYEMCVFLQGDTFFLKKNTFFLPVDILCYYINLTKNKYYLIHSPLFSSFAKMIIYINLTSLDLKIYNLILFILFLFWKIKKVKTWHIANLTHFFHFVFTRFIKYFFFIFLVSDFYCKTIFISLKTFFTCNIKHQ